MGPHHAEEPGQESLRSGWIIIAAVSPMYMSLATATHHRVKAVGLGITAVQVE